jgi:hypothetical protein
MRLLIVPLLFVVLNVSSQKPYSDSLKGVYQIAEAAISRRTDTIVAYNQKTRDSDIRAFERIIICFDKNSDIIRIDKVFHDSNRFLFAYFKAGSFYLMQWNLPSECSIVESIDITDFARDGEILKFYMALLTLKSISMPLPPSVRL